MSGDTLDTLFPSALRRKLSSLRNDLHRHPELSFQEERTSAKLYGELEQLQPSDLKRVAGTGVVARIKGKNPNAPVVAIRGDIDALPIHEATDLPFSSEEPGVMHACGHDVHATWTVGAAHLLSERPATGDVLILLQPGEETGRGAMAVLNDKALDGVAAIFGAHVDRRFIVGQIVAQAGPLAAAADEFRIRLTGRGSHGARPHEGTDPVVGAAALVGTLQTIVSRRLDPGAPAVVSVGEIHAGSAPNIIPESATLSGTTRSLDPQVRQQIHRELERIVQRVCQAHGLEPQLNLELGPPPIVNEERPIQWARKAVASLLSSEGLVSLDSYNMAGEDFAYYLERIEGCFLRIGAREPDGRFIPGHSPQFYAAEESIFVGAAVLAETARVASAELAAGVVISDK